MIINNKAIHWIHLDLECTCSCWSKIVFRAALPSAASQKLYPWQALLSMVTYFISLIWNFLSFKMGKLIPISQNYSGVKIRELYIICIHAMYYKKIFMRPKPYIIKLVLLKWTIINQVTGIKEGACCSENWVLHATNELSNSTSKTNDVLYVG